MDENEQTAEENEQPLRKAAVRFVLRTLHNRFSMVSPEKRKALELCKKYGITGRDLITEMEEIVHSA